MKFGDDAIVGCFMQIYRCSDKLPEDNQYVLAYFPHRPWQDSNAIHNEHKWRVVKFCRGISLKEREEMPENFERKHYIISADQHGNNLVPFNWQEFGPSSFFGQEAHFWIELPQIKEVMPSE